MTAPSGINIAFQFANPIQLVLPFHSDTAIIYYTLTAGNNVAPGKYNVTVTGTSGPYTAAVSFYVTVVQYLVTIDNDFFNPSNLTVPAGATVYWINIDPTVGDQEVHNVVAYNGAFSSPVLSPNPYYDSYAFTFNTAGTYLYTDQYTPGLNGTVIVTS